jgi:hypothetical protein
MLKATSGRQETVDYMDQELRKMRREQENLLNRIAKFAPENGVECCSNQARLNLSTDNVLTKSLFNRKHFS